MGVVFLDYDWEVGEVIWRKNPYDPEGKKRPAIVVGINEESETLSVIYGTSREKYTNFANYIRINDDQFSKITYFDCETIGEIPENDYGEWEGHLEKSNTMEVMKRVIEYNPELRRNSF